MSWTPEVIDELTRLWNEGVATAEIGRRLALTKNAVIGKANRMHLAPRPSPIKRVEKVVVEFQGPACSWPIGHPREPGFHFCGAPALPGKPYCEHHVARAYIPARVAERKDRAA